MPFISYNNSTSYNDVLSCHFIMTFIKPFYLGSLAPSHRANSCAAAGLVRQLTPSLRDAYAEGYTEGFAEGYSLIRNIYYTS